MTGVDCMHGCLVRSSHALHLPAAFLASQLAQRRAAERAGTVRPGPNFPQLSCQVTEWMTYRNRLWRDVCSMPLGSYKPNSYCRRTDSCKTAIRKCSLIILFRDPGPDLHFRPKLRSHPWMGIFWPYKHSKSAPFHTVFIHLISCLLVFQFIHGIYNSLDSRQKR